MITVHELILADKLSYNLFLSIIPFLHPQKKPENQMFSDAFRGYKNGTFA